MGQDLYAKKGKVEIPLGWLGRNYEALENSCPKSGKVWMLKLEQLEKMRDELDRETKRIDKYISQLVAYCPNKKNDLHEKIGEYEEWIDGMKENLYRYEEVCMAIRLMEEGFKIGISY
jgi:hypothetical protein